MASNYNITFLYNIMGPNGGPSFSIDGGIPGKLVLTKERCFEDANTDTMPVLLKDGRSKAKCDADRAYLHYISDCWLDDEPVVLQPAELE